MVSWLFCNRSTGRLTIAQPPNLSIVVVVLLTAARWIFAPVGTAGISLDVAVGAALGWWSIDELVRGVNPFRRILGAGVLIWTIASTVRRFS